MAKRGGLQIAAALLLGAALTACGAKQGAPHAMAVNVADAAAPAGEAKRYLAIKRTLEVEAEPGKVQPLWAALQDKCLTVGGDVVSTEYRTGEDEFQSATLSLRVPPAAVPKLLEVLSQGGTLRSNQTEADDKTAEVIDVEAHLKNLADERDRLRQLLQDRTAKLSDVLEVQKTLTEVQASLDSYAGQRKQLAEQTEKVRIDISIHTPHTLAAPSAWRPLKDSVHEAAYLFSGSLSVLINVVVALLPWVLVFVPAFIGIRRWLRRRRTAKM